MGMAFRPATIARFNRIKPQYLPVREDLLADVRSRPVCDGALKAHGAISSASVLVQAPGWERAAWARFHCAPTGTAEPSP
jgi:hypothetical protein